jgi:hypothetical protein
VKVGTYTRSAARRIILSLREEATYTIWSSSLAARRLMAPAIYIHRHCHCLLLYPEERSSNFPLYVVKYLPDHTALHTRRQSSRKLLEFEASVNTNFLSTAASASCDCDELSWQAPFWQMKRTSTVRMITEGDDTFGDVAYLCIDMSWVQQFKKYVAYRTVARQRPRNKQLYNSRC